MQALRTARDFSRKVFMMNDTLLTPESILARHVGDGAVVALDSLGVIEVGGDDAQEFLQGQFSNDIDAVAAVDGAVAHCQLNAYCNPKGRALAVVRVLRLAERWWLLAPRAQVDSLMKRLRMFVLRAKVSIEAPALARWGVIGCGDGVGAPALKADAVVRAPVAGVIPRQLIIGDAQAMRSLDITPTPSDDLWRLTDILSGVAQVYPATAEQFIPQFINLERVGGVSFSKGCYPGQEIIARLRHRGRVKRRMLAARAVGVDALAPGDALFDGDGKTVGTVVDAVNTGAREFIFNATAPSPLADTTLSLGADATVTRIALPNDAKE